MKKRILKFNPNHLANPILIITAAVILRLLPHPPNVSPIAAMALFGGSRLDKKYALLIPFIALLLSDLLIGFYTLPMMLFVYGSFLLTGCIGIWLKKRRNKPLLIGSAVFSSLLFYTITNFGVWLTSPMYAKTFPGLLSCYTMAIPFFTNTLIGDIIYTLIFFGSYTLILNLNKNLNSAKKLFPKY